MRSDLISHRNGVWYYDAPIPHRWHRCRAWTAAILYTDGVRKTIFRCACGAIRVNHGTWLNKNERRRHNKAKRATRELNNK